MQGRDCEGKNYQNLVSFVEEASLPLLSSSPPYPSLTDMGKSKQKNIYISVFILYMHITYTCSYKAVLYIKKLLTVSFSVNHLQSYRGHNQNLTPLAIWTSGAVTRFLLGQYHSREQDTLKEWGLRQFLGSSRRGGTKASWVLSRALGQKIRNISNW